MKFKQFVILCGFALCAALTIQHFETIPYTVDTPQSFNLADQTQPTVSNGDADHPISELNPLLITNGLF